jgi:hypothetical protein
MKINQEQENLIIKHFQKMDSKDDFIDLLNTTKCFLYGDKFHPFEMQQLNYYINKDNFQDNTQAVKDIAKLFGDNETDNVLINKGAFKKRFFYTEFTIKKKSGKDRTIHAPIKGLKEFQKTLNIILQCIFDSHPAATGFVIGKSITDNASPHINQNYVYNIDLKDFFPSIDKSRIWGRLLVEPFKLNSTPERKKIANMIAALCCHTIEVERFEEGQWKNKFLSVLPQGAPTSPILTNAICERLDIRLSGVAKRFSLNYTRYADDITFSSKHNTYEVEKGHVENIYNSDSTFNKEIKRIIEDQRFYIKESKIRLQKRGYRQEVTGIVVNDKANIDKRYIKQLRQWLYYWENYGYEKACGYFIQKYIISKGHIKKGQPNMMMVLDGKLLYLKMVKGENDPTYLKLKNRFDNLVGTEKKDQKQNKNIVDLILHIGLEEAMKNYRM